MTGLFVNAGFLAGLGLVAAPILIHLFFRWRYRPVRWAPMEFLLESLRKNRRRVLVEQLLLLAARCAVVALFVLVLARPLATESLAAFIGGGGRVDHFIVLDDSYSMRARQGADSALDVAQRAIVQLAERLAQRPGSQTLTLFRSSSMATPDIDAQTVDGSMATGLRTLFDRALVSFAATPPGTALGQLADRLDGVDAASPVVHFFGDFRKKDWSSDAAAAPLKRLDARKAIVRLIDVSGAPGANLSVVSLETAGAGAAVGVPVRLEGKARNHAGAASSSLSLQVAVDGRSAPDTPLPSISAGQETTIGLDVLVNQPGVHAVRVALPTDALEPDNVRWLALDAAERREVLLIDGSASRDDANFVALALAPGGGARTGLDPVIRGPEALTSGSFGGARVIFLLNVPSLAKAAAKALEGFVASGGGLVVFLGDQVSLESYNQTLFGSGGLFPAPLAPATAVAPNADESAASLVVEPHPLFRVFAGERNPFLETVRIERTFGLGELPAEGPAKVIARRKDQRPVAIETTRGKGKAVAFLTSAGPAWNSWARNPSFVVVMLELCSRLARSADEPSGVVGEPWRIAIDPRTDRPEAKVTPPADGDSPATSELATATSEATHISYDQTARPGVYVATIAKQDGSTRTVARAVNVDPAEGDLTKPTPSEIEGLLAGLHCRYSTLDGAEGSLSPSRVEPRDFLILGLIALLVAEQALAYAFTYRS